MSKDPTTTSQVQAYRFVLRRMESALVRKDAVMLHEPMRQHLRATAVGVILSVLGLAAFFLIGKFGLPGEFEPHQNEIVIGSPSEAVFVVDGKSLRLIPVPNLTSARLLLADHSSSAPKITKVADSALADIGREQPRGLPGAPPLPASENLLSPADWSVCDAPDGQSQLSTTVLVREQPLSGRALGDDEALLVAESSTAATYLVWRGRKAQIDLSDAGIQTVYKLGSVTSRKVSTGLLNAIPSGPPLKLPDIASSGQPSRLSGVQVGEVVRLKGADQPSYYLLLQEGKQQVNDPVAQLIHSHYGGNASIRDVTLKEIAPVPEVRRLNFDGFPDRALRPLTDTENLIACLSWSGPDQDPEMEIRVSPQLPLGAGEIPVEVPRADRGVTADKVFLEPTKGVLVRGAVPGQKSGTGTIWLITDRGMRYVVPTLEVARALELGDTTSTAPESILALLPIGPSLDPKLAKAPLTPH